MLFHRCSVQTVGNIVDELGQTVREERAATHDHTTPYQTNRPGPPHRVNATLIRPLPVPAAVRAARIR
jgi:hypothetical protein